VSGICPLDGKCICFEEGEQQTSGNGRSEHRLWVHEVGTLPLWSHPFEEEDGIIKHIE
jgi:hypothetical protein